MERSISARELAEWRAFWSIDPWGEQRSDMRMARTVANLLSPHMKPGAKIDPMDFMLFPDDAHSIPDDISDQEKAWMLKLERSA